MATWLENAFWLGDNDVAGDGVYFDAVKAGDGWTVKAMVDSDTGSFTAELPVPGEFKTYKDAINRAVCAAIEWCMENGVWVSHVDIAAVRKAAETVPS